MAQPGSGADAGWDWRRLTQVAVAEAQRVLRNRDDAEDAAQEAIIRAFRARERCTTPDSPAAWVRVITRNECYRLLGRRLPQEPPDAAPELSIDDHSEAVHDRLLASSAVRGVPAGDRVLLLRRYVLDQTSAQIAVELAIPAATVRVRLHRAGNRIREQLASRTADSAAPVTGKPSRRQRPRERSRLEDAAVAVDEEAGRLLLVDEIEEDAAVDGARLQGLRAASLPEVALLPGQRGGGDRVVHTPDGRRRDPVLNR